MKTIRILFALLALTLSAYTYAGPVNIKGYYLPFWH